MRPRGAKGFSLFHKALLCAAAVATPAGMRVEWLREWQAETWHVERSCANRWRVTAFCLGAFKDAWSLRRHALKEKTRPISLHGSAGQCLLALAMVLATSYLVARSLPELQMATNASLEPANAGLVLIQRANDEKIKNTEIPFAQYRGWAGNRQLYFDELAFFRTSRENVLDGDTLKGGWKIAYATSDLFRLLGIPVQFAREDKDARDGLPTVIVSDAMWRRAFGADQEIAGKVLNVGGREARIAGVATTRAWRLPGHVDAWVLEPENAMPANARGYMVAHLTQAGRAEMWAGSMHITAYAQSHEIDLNGSAIDQEQVGSWQLFKFALFLAILALPAITSVSMGEYSPASHKPPWPRRVVRWLFLAAKIALLLPIVYYASLDLAYWRSFGSTYAADYIQLFAAFAICLAGMRWILLDQRQRCPVCLRRVAHPAQVGLASRTFLAWNGTELMCEGGHTLLHVPGLETSWFAAPRWMYLDPSWEFLFAGTDAG
jgi:hypothetical protein